MRNINPLPGCIPTGGLHQHPQLVPHPLRPPDLHGQPLDPMQEYGDGVIRVDRLADAVCYWLDLRFEGPEQAIPNDERTRVVLIPILSV